MDDGSVWFLPYPTAFYQPIDHEMYRGDGVHLLDKGMDIFIADIQHGLQEALSLPVGART